MASIIPWGFKFRPTDEEKMKYLANKATGLGCDNDFIRTEDLYGEQEPWEIFGAGRDNEETELYFFTALKKVANKKSGQRIARNVGQGFWSNKGQKDAVYGRKGGIIGYKRCFRYERKKGDDDDDENVGNGKWLLKEYTLPDNMTMKSRVKEEYKGYALCVLKRKAAGSGRNNDCPDVEIGLDDMLASILNYEPVPEPEPEPEEDWLQRIDWNELANFDQANTWNHELGDFTRISQPCSVEEMLGGDECLPPHQNSAPLIHM